MQRVLLLLDPKGIGKDVVALRLLPEIVELDQLTHGPGSHLLALRIQCCRLPNPYPVLRNRNYFVRFRFRLLTSYGYGENLAFLHSTISFFTRKNC
jgi:hypothetical protein